MIGKKRVLLVVLALLIIGSLIAALTSSLPVMLLARTIQGAGGAIFPLAFSIIRDEFPGAMTIVALVATVFLCRSRRSPHPAGSTRPRC